MQQIFGVIPEKIKFIYSKDKFQVTSGPSFDDSNKILVYNTFVVDASNKKTIATAEKNAGQGTYDYNAGTTKTREFASFEKDNTPIKDVKILSLPVYNNSYMECKVLVDDYYVDLDGQVLIEAMQSVGIKKGSILNGEYIFAIVNSRMTLVRVGSKLHDICIEYTERNNTKSIGKRELDVGGIYQDKKNHSAIFLGYVNTTSFRKDHTKQQKYVYGQVYKPSYEYIKTDRKKEMLFYSIRSYEKLEDEIKSLISAKVEFYNIASTKSHKFIEKVGSVELPDNMIELLRSKAKGEIMKMIKEKNDYNLEYTIEYKSVYLNMYKFGTFRPDNFDISKYITLY